ncbi:MAG: hypothetical protein H7177_00425 [Rhizobacter sp.]|nr:hypothetical protein [Bacteriovorax sp.]
MKFLKVFLPIFIPLCVYYFLVNHFIYPKGSPKSTRALASLNYIESVKNTEVDYLVMGDSTAVYGINPAGLSKNSQSVSMIASPVYTAYKILEKLENIKINKGILLTQTFIYDHYDLDIWGYFVPNKIYSFNDVLTIFCLEKKPACTIFEKLDIGTKYLLARAYLNSYALDEIQDRLKYRDRNYAGMYAAYSKILRDNKGFFKKKRRELAERSVFLEPLREHFSMPLGSVPPAEIIYLRKIITYAKERHIPLYYIIMPTAAYALDRGGATEPYRQSLKEFLKDDIGPDMQLVDTLPMEHLLNLGDFWDFNHVNDLGARKIESFLRSQLHIIN